MTGPSKKQMPRGKARADGSVDRGFLLIVGLPLLVAAVVINLRSVVQLQWPAYLFQALIWLVTVVIVLNDARSRRRADRPGLAAARPPRTHFLVGLTTQPRSKRTIVFSLAVVAVFAALSHYHFGRFHGRGHFLHYHDIYHYSMGSKYFPELGYDGLYAATQEALVENDRSFAKSISVVKNLREYRLEGRAVSLARAATVARVFSAERWRQFKQDVRFFQSKIPAEQWQFVVVDHGFNATPFWAFLASPFCGDAPFSDGTLSLFASLDLLLIAAMLLLVWWAFGRRTGLVFAIFFFANFFATFDFTGGAFLRQFWIAFLVGFVCCYQKGKMAPAGLCLALAALDRAFPLVLALLPLVLFAKETLRRRGLRHGQTRLVAVFLATLVVLGGASALLTERAQPWRDWYANISAHDRSFSINQIAMRNLFVVHPTTALDRIDAGWDESSWQRERETLAARSRNTLGDVRVILLLFLLALAAKERDWGVSLGLLAFGPFVLFYPANYYGVVLALTVIFWQRSFGLALAMMTLQGLFWLLHVFFPTPVHLEALHWLVALCLVATLVGFLVRNLLRHARGSSRFRGTCLVLGVGSAALLFGGIVTDVQVARADPGWAALDVVPEDVHSVRDAKVHSERMADWSGGWSRDDHVVFMASGPGAQGIVKVPVRRAGSYRVKVDYTAAPPFGMVGLSVNEAARFEPVNLLAPRPVIRSVVYEGVNLNEGVNDFTFAVTGKDPGSTHHHFAVDRILLMRQDDGADVGQEADAEASRRRAVEQALSWLAAHPADPFDGGLAAVCAEIVALHALVSNPKLSASHAIIRRALRERIAALNALPNYRAQPDEYEMLVTAQHVAQQLDLDLQTFEKTAKKLRLRAKLPHRGRSGPEPLFLCTYLNRLQPADEVPCALEQSVLYQEHDSGQLPPLLEGAVDRQKSPVVSRVLGSIAADVFALSDYGHEALAGNEVLSDGTFWSRLCEHGIRWGRETGDVVLVAKLVLVTRVVGLEPGAGWLRDAVDYLVRHQEPDGSFGVASSHGPNAFRDGVLAASMAIAASL